MKPFLLCLALIGLAGPGSAHVLEGPTAPKGMKLLPGGEFALDAETPSVPGHSLRVRFFEVEPGGVIPVHSHEGRPAIAVVIEGEMTEHRSDEEGPVVLGPGGISLEDKGLKHWWENTGTVPARIIGYDLYKRPE
ncbi:MAG: cupin domain-containing protein [Pseudomonadota bacterium]